MRNTFDGVFFPRLGITLCLEACNNFLNIRCHAQKLQTNVSNSKGEEKCQKKHFIFCIAERGF